MEKWLPTKYPQPVYERILSQIDWEAWVKQGGANPSIAKLNFTTEGSVQMEALADAYIALGGDSSPANFSDYLNATDP